mmetsp:Transcript_31575/g.35414  ORF Transcript_31575/g.35414 Transcript_31575/m.35414 type:complete len:255 (+) Transcript_31575:631-1395(+)
MVSELISVISVTLSCSRYFSKAVSLGAKKVYFPSGLFKISYKYSRVKAAHNSENSLLLQTNSAIVSHPPSSTQTLDGRALGVKVGKVPNSVGVMVGVLLLSGSTQTLDGRALGVKVGKVPNSVGVIVGSTFPSSVGRSVGDRVGRGVGPGDGGGVGPGDGGGVGPGVGGGVGVNVGEREGGFVGLPVHAGDGGFVGLPVHSGTGAGVGCGVGRSDGLDEGLSVGLLVGRRVLVGDESGLCCNASHWLQVVSHSQ